LLDQQLATALVQYLVPQGTEGDPKEAALKLLDMLATKDIE
jgi:hypothetical protein